LSRALTNPEPPSPSNLNLAFIRHYPAVADESQRYALPD
jgi:hypothetical protein